MIISCLFIPFLRVLAIVAIVLLIFGLGMVASNGFYVFQIFDDYAAGIPLLVIALFQCIGVAWIYGNERYNHPIFLGARLNRRRRKM